MNKIKPLRIINSWQFEIKLCYWYYQDILIVSAVQVQPVREGHLRRVEREPEGRAARVPHVVRLSVGVLQGDGGCEGGTGAASQQHGRPPARGYAERVLGETVSTRSVTIS